MKWLIVAALLSGCSTPRYQQTWQAMNFIDYGQTMAIAKSPRCHAEGSEPTRTLIGEHPSETQVTVMFAAYALAYHYGSKWLDRKAERGDSWKAIRTVTQVGLLSSKAYNIARNHDHSLRMFQEDHCAATRR